MSKLNWRVPKRLLTRRRFLATGVIGAAALAGADALFVEPKDYQVRKVNIRLQRLPEAFDGFRIAQLSDIHFGPYMSKAGVERAMRMVQPFQPDLVALTGDFVSHPFGQPDGRAGALFIEPCADVLHKWKNMRFVAIAGKS